MQHLRTASEVEAQYQQIQGDLSGKSLVIIPTAYPDQESVIGKVYEFLAPHPDNALVELVSGAEPKDWTAGNIFDKAWVVSHPEYYSDTQQPWTIFGLTPEQCTAFAANANHSHRPIGELFIVSGNQFFMEDSLLEAVNRVLNDCGCVTDFGVVATSWLFEDFMELFPCIDVATHHTHFPEPNNQSPRGFRAQDCSAYYLKPGYTFEDFLRMVSEFALWPVRKGNATA